MSSEARFMPLDWLPAVPAESDLNKSLLHAMLQIHKDTEARYSARAALEAGDPSVYTGAAGVAYMYWHAATSEGLSTSSQRRLWRDKADNYMNAALRLVKPHKKSHSSSTFLTGMAGVYSVAAALAYSKNETKVAAEMRQHVLSLASTCVTEAVPSEILYGRTGYLSCLLFMAANAGLQLSDCQEVIAGAVQLILQDGTRLATKEWPMMWEWHGKNYLGAAHGLCGILLVLLYFRALVEGFGCGDLLKSTVDALVAHQLPSGNLPSSLGSPSDRLVHWCHGAPGFIPLMTEAYAAYGEQKYIDAAHSAAKVVYERGLLKKGIGLCHGIGGNGLALLNLYRATGSEQALMQARQYGLFVHIPNVDAADKLKHQLRMTPDRPESLFEGSAGFACFLVALLECRASTETLGRRTRAATPWLM